MAFLTILHTQQINNYIKHRDKKNQSSNVNNIQFTYCVYSSCRWCKHNIYLVSGLSKNLFWYIPRNRWWGKGDEFKIQCIFSIRISFKVWFLHLTSMLRPHVYFPIQLLLGDALLGIGLQENLWPSIWSSSSPLSLLLWSSPITLERYTPQFGVLSRISPPTNWAGPSMCRLWENVSSFP